MDQVFEEEVCIFCSKALSVAPTVKLTDKGCITINHINQSIKVTAGQYVHKHCRLAFYKKNVNKNEAPVMEQPTLNTEPTFSQENCVFCGELAILRGNKGKVFPVKTEKFQRTIQNIITKRGDEWAKEVEERIGTTSLYAIGATYHQKCNLNFRKEPSKNPTVGRPPNEDRQMAFLKVVCFMEEHEGNAFKVNDLANVMKNEVTDNIAEYSTKFLKAKLIEHFGENIVFLQSKGKPDYVVFRHSANFIISEFYKNHEKSDTNAERKKIVDAASRLISSDIQSLNYNKDEYPTAGQIADLQSLNAFVPDSLTTLLSGIIKTKSPGLKINAIAQAICQAACQRRIIAPLQIALGVLVHHHTSCKFLVQIMAALGLCVSYEEALKYELCAAASEADYVSRNIEKSTNLMIKFVADNVDHDSNTIDGKNTFHGMGMISTITPFQTRQRVIKRTKSSIEDVRAIGTVEICQYLGEPSSKIIYGDIDALGTASVEKMMKIDLLLNITWRYQAVRPSWSGVMQHIYRGSHPGKSTVTILPMIDLNPSSFDCIYSTLIYLVKEAERQHVTPIITFDQPLYWKAQIIIQNEATNSRLKKIVLLLGGFHTQMSFLGAIGYLHEGLGLQEILETVYATNSVPHILSGKAYSRAIRGCFMVDVVLNTLLLEEIHPTKMSESEWKEFLSKANNLFDDLMAHKVSPLDVESSTLLQSIQEEIDLFKETVSGKSKTSKLWLQYMDMVDVLKQTIRGERTGNWSGHLTSVRRKLPYFAATGHNHYTKSAYIYLEQMQQLQTTHPDVHDAFSNGHYVVRRSDRYWDGLPCDLVIEQGLMRSIKSQGGLTRGRGIGENQRLIWINSMPACVEMKNALQQLTGIHYETSEQHKHFGSARQERDSRDLKIIYDFLKDRNPFKASEVTTLLNINDGMEAHPKVNVENAKQIGEKIISSMKNQNVENYVFRKKNRAVQMTTRNTIVIDEEPTNIDPQLLFQRLLLIARKMDEDQLRNIFSFELSQRPSVFFDEYGFLRNGNNSSLTDLLWSKIGNIPTKEMNRDNCRCILCGNYLINKVSWQKNETYDEICSKYVSFAHQYQYPIIVFKEYSSEPSPSINDQNHLRQSKGIQGVNVVFSGDMPFNGKKESFLMNLSNKYRFIDLLALKLRESGCTVITSGTDPNVTLAKSIISSASSKDTIVIADEFNILFVLCHYYKIGLNEIFFKCDVKTKTGVWNLGKLYSVLGKDIMSYLPYVHAIGGCKTTSHLFGIGKGVPLKKVINDAEFRSTAMVFVDPKSTHSQIIEAGDKALVMLYNGKKEQKLNELRFERFNKKVIASKSFISVETLPPTEAAAKYHHLRVFLQTQIWLGNENLNPLLYGWKRIENKFFPETTDQEVAPMELLRGIKCGCKGDCSTLKCTCKYNEMKCTVACSECRGTSCCNSTKISDEDEDEDDI